MTAKRRSDLTCDGLESSDLLAHVERIGSTIAASHAEDVDRAARFPIETFASLREASVLSAMVPVELGGSGCDLRTTAEMCTSLAKYCTSSAMILAMHHIQVAAIVHHRSGAIEFDDYLRDLVRQQRLIASATSEVGTGGDLGRSLACLEVDGDRFHFTKLATTVSYGEHADDLLVTLRRNDEAASGDQVLVLVHGDALTLDDVGEWNTLGMRGTCSPPATITGQGHVWQVLSDPFRKISSTTMVSVSHILWSAVWTGVATDAFDRARKMLQLRARKDPDSGVLAAARLVTLTTQLHGMQDRLGSAIRTHDERMGRDASKREMTLGEALRANDLKLATSEDLIEVVGQAILVAGIAAYHNEGAFSLGRHLRDAHSAPLMINNDRIRGANADLLSVYKGR